MITEATLNQIVNAIYTEENLYGCIIGFQGNGQSRVLHSGLTPSVNYGRVVVIIEEGDFSGPVPASQIPAQPTELVSPPPSITNRSKLWPELAGAGLSCGLTVLSGIAVFGGVAAEIPSGGTSTVVVVAGYIGFTTSVVQCGNAVIRVGAIAADPDGTTLSEWDENTWYKYGILAVDAIGVVTGLASLSSGIRNLLAVLERRGGLATAAELEKMTREQRRVAIQKALQQAIRTPEAKKAVKEALLNAGLKPGQVGATLAGKAGSVERARVVSTVLAKETARRLEASIVNLIGAGGIVASGGPGSAIGSASGSVNFILVHVFPGFPQ